MRSKILIEVQVRPTDVMITIGGLPHLHFRRSELVCYQSYIRSHGPREPIYYIEFSTSYGLVTSDYDKKSLWEGILTALRESKLFDQMQGEGSLPGKCRMRSIGVYFVLGREYPRTRSSACS